FGNFLVDICGEVQGTFASANATAKQLASQFLILVLIEVKRPIMPVEAFTPALHQLVVQSGTNYSVASPMVEMSFLRRLRHACRWVSLAPWKPISSGLQASLGVSLVSRG